jgi:ATP-binding cassette subfamily B protein
MPTLAYLSTADESIKDPTHPKRIRSCKGKLEVRSIAFSYQTEVSKPLKQKRSASGVFDGFDLRLTPGEQVGVVGLSGAGKSTLASLIMRFDEVDAGSIEIDGIDIRDLSQDDLHQLIAYVPQEPLLFHRSIRENITYFRPNATDSEVSKAAKAAHAHEFIKELNNGYDTLVGERGIKLSGGQKQRIAIARAILKNAPIMLFDEATSALDSESERIIQAALPEIIGKKTALVIAHRLSTIAGLDRIIVMHGGKIEEQGTHAELLAKRGRYHSLWQKQTEQR